MKYSHAQTHTIRLLAHFYRTVLAQSCSKQHGYSFYITLCSDGSSSANANHGISSELLQNYLAGTETDMIVLLKRQEINVVLGHGAKIWLLHASFTNRIYRMFF